MENRNLSLDLEVTEVESKLSRGCGNSSSTNPRCTCMPLIVADSNE
jgi:hypothetical protein